MGGNTASRPSLRHSPPRLHLLQSSTRVEYPVTSQHIATHPAQERKPAACSRSPRHLGHSRYVFERERAGSVDFPAFSHHPHFHLHTLHTPSPKLLFCSPIAEIQFHWSCLS